jgi:SAM-dependent methyltransferase
MATEPVETSASALWDIEYERGGIPSSVRSAPSGTLLDFLASEHARGLRGAALDIGCGGGRNARHLAACGFDTLAFDYSRSQVDALTASVRGTKKLRVALQDVSKPWPIKDGSIDLAVDTFCLKHQIDLAGLANYAAELTRCLAPGARYVVSFATRADGYYARFPETEQFGPGLIIRDPGNGIRSRLYDCEELVALFPQLTPLMRNLKQGQNEMHGRTYARQTAVVYFGKR